MILICKRSTRNTEITVAHNDNLELSTQKDCESSSSSQNYFGASSSAQSDCGTSSAQELTFCLCNGPEFGEMVLCDNDSCPIKWYHFPCVSLVTKPKGKWYCPSCQGGLMSKSSKPAAILQQSRSKVNNSISLFLK